MTKLLEFLIIVLLIWLGVNFIAAISKRTALISGIRGLKRSLGAEIEYKRMPYLSLFGLSESPDFTVRVGNVVYIVRTYNGSGIGKVVHFASPEYTVRFSRMRTASYVRGRAKQRMFTARRGFAIGSKVIYLPPLKTDGLNLPYGAKVVPVLIFNPTPGEVSFVTPEKTSIRVAFTGDDVYGTRIFTASTFVSFVEREYRAASLASKDVNRANDYAYFG